MDAAAIVATVMGAIVILGGVLSAGVLWGRKTGGDEALRAQVDALKAALSQAQAAIGKLTEKLDRALRELGRDVDGVDLHHRDRWHEHDRQIQAISLDLAALRGSLGIPAPVHGDVTPPVRSVPHRTPTGPQRRPSRADESG